MRVHDKRHYRITGVSTEIGHELHQRTASSDRHVHADRRWCTDAWRKRLVEVLSHFWSETLRGQAHVALAVCALVTGPLIFTRAKGTPSHRALGMLYAGAMLIVNVSALTMYELTARPNLFHVFAVMSLGSTGPGVFCILRGNVTSHYFFMSWSYFGLLAAFLSQLATQLGFFPWIATRLGGLSVFFIVLIATGLASFAASALINGNARRLLPLYGGRS
jgi:uncharacterized membrane protein